MMTAFFPMSTVTPGAAGWFAAPAAANRPADARMMVMCIAEDSFPVGHWLPMQTIVVGLRAFGPARLQVAT